MFSAPYAGQDKHPLRAAAHQMEAGEGRARLYGPRIHRALLDAAPGLATTVRHAVFVAFGSWSAAQMRAGVAGISMWVMP